MKLHKFDYLNLAGGALAVVGLILAVIGCAVLSVPEGIGMNLDLSPLVYVGVALIAAGLAAYVVVWLVIRLILRLQEDGTVNYGSAVGKEATVYVSVPPNREGRGKITLVLQGRYTEADAVTDEKERIPVDAQVTVCSSQGDVFVVKRKG